MLMNSFDLYVPCILINDEFPGVHNISDTHTHTHISIFYR